MKPKKFMQKGMALFVVLMMALSLFSGIAFANEEETQSAETGSGTITTITSSAGLAAMTSGDYVLGADITIDAASWTPAANFTGTFDGGKSSGYKITWTGTSEASTASISSNYAIFGSSSGTIRNLKVEGNLYVTGTNADYVSAVVGYNNGGIIDGVENAANVICSGTCYNVGGICGLNNGGYILNSSNSGAVTGYSKVGGIVGENDGVVSTCFNTAAITGTNASKNGVGGIAGRNGDNNTATTVGKIWHCYNTGNISCVNGKWIGGICGFLNSRSECQSCFNTGDLSAYSYKDHIAGKVDSTSGYTGTVTNCFGLSAITTAERHDGAGIVSDTGLNSSATVNSLNFNGTVSRWSAGAQHPELTMDATISEVQPGSITQGTLSTVYISNAGNDNNTGADAAHPVKTLSQAVARAATSGTVTIYALTTIQVGNENIYGTGNTTAGLCNITVKKVTSGFTGSTQKMVNVIGNAVLSGIYFNGSGFTKTISVAGQASLAIRNGTVIINSAKGIDVEEEATLELNKSSISGNTYSIYSKGNVIVQLNSSVPVVGNLNTSLRLGAKIYSEGILTFESGNIINSSASQVTSFIESNGRNSVININGATIDGNGNAANAISMTDGTINISSGIITDVSNYAITTNKRINLTPDSASTNCNINGKVFLRQGGNVFVGASLEGIVNNIVVECENPALRTTIGSYSDELSSTQVNKFEYNSTEYTILPDNNTHSLKMISNITEAPVTSESMMSLLSNENEITITNADLVGKTAYIATTDATYILDVDRLDIPFSIPNGGNIKFTQNISFGENGYILLPQNTTNAVCIEGPTDGITIQLSANKLFQVMNEIPLTIKNVSVVGCEDQFESFGLSTTYLDLENVSFNNINVSHAFNIEADDAVLNNITISNIQSESENGLRLTNLTINKAQITNIKNECEDALEDWEPVIGSNNVTLAPLGDIYIDAYCGDCDTETGMTLSPLENITISKYLINGCEQAIPTEPTDISYEDEDQIKSIKIEVASAPTEPTFAASIENVSKDLAAAGETFTADVVLKSDTVPAAAQLDLNVNSDVAKVVAVTPAEGIGTTDSSSTEGTAKVSFYGNTASAADGLKVATVTFEAVADGTASITLADDGVAGTAGDPDAEYTVTIPETASEVTIKSPTIETAAFGGNYQLVRYTPNAAVAEGKTVKYGDQEMYLADDGSWYCVIAKDVTPSLDSVTIAEGTQTGYTAVDKGDVNENGKINIIDAQIAYDIANSVYKGFEKLTVTGVLKADVNNSLAVDALDARAIQVYVHTGSFAAN